MYHPQIPDVDPDVAHYTDDKVRQMAEQMALLQYNNVKHWEAMAQQLAELCHQGSISDDEGGSLVGFTQHCIQDTQEVQWKMATAMHTFADWANTAPDAKEAARRKSVVGLAVIKAKWKMAQIKDVDDIKKIVAEWDYSEHFADVDSWDWEGEKSNLQDTIRTAVAEKLGIDPDKMQNADAEVHLAKMAPDGSITEISREEFEKDTGMSVDEVVKQSLKNPDNLEVVVDHPHTSLTDLIGHLSERKNDDEEKDE